MVKNQDVNMEFSLFSEIWKMFKRFYNVSNDKAYWDKLLEEAYEIEKRYENELCNDLLISVIMELERKYKKQNKGVNVQ